MEGCYKKGSFKVFTVHDDLSSGLACHVNKIIETIQSGDKPHFCEILSSSVNTVVYKFKIFEQGYVYKEFLPRGLSEGVKSIFFGSRGQRAFKGARLLEDAGLFTPKVLMYGVGGGFLKSKSFIVAEFLDGAEDIYDLIDSLNFKDLSAFMSELGSAVGKLHKGGIFHGDLRPGNIMVVQNDGLSECFFIDNERNKKFVRIPIELIVKNLVQLNMIQSSKLKFTHRTRFLRAYMEETRDILKDKKELSRLVQSRTAERMNKEKHGGLYN